MQFLPDTIWLSEGVCIIRVIADLCLVACTPWLLYTIRKRGAEGISVETQILRLIVFSARYLDLLSGHTVSLYNTLMKGLILVSSLHVVISLIFRYRAYKSADLKSGIFLLCLPLLFAMIMSTFFTYQHTFMEVSWALSQYLGSVSEIPQIILFYNSKDRDRRIAIYLALAAGYRAFYIPHWVLRYLRDSFVDPIAVFSGVVSTTIYLVMSVMILFSRGKLSRSESPRLEEGSTKIFDETLSPAVAEKDLITFPQEKS